MEDSIAKEKKWGKKCLEIIIIGTLPLISDVVCKYSFLEFPCIRFYALIFE